MENIPQDVLYEAFEASRADPSYDFLRLVGRHFADAAAKTRALRRKSWQSTSRELDGVADHIRAYADQLEQFGINNVNGDVITVGDDETRWEDPRDTVNGETDQPATVAPAAKGKKAKPQLPGNTDRCASFRRATPDDPFVCDRDRGHEGDHMTVQGDTWPRTPSGHVCGDVVILHDGTALNCARPLGHDGDEHHDGRYQFWPRGVGTSRQVRTCERCNLDRHDCPGCGEPIGHYAGACTDCAQLVGDEPVVITDAKITSISLGPDGITTHITAQTPDGPAKIASTDPNPQVTVPPCGDGQPGAFSPDVRDSCMLPQGHTGKHIGYTGARWEQVAPAATLGEQADQMRATMIPGPRPESDGPTTVSTMTPSAVMVAEMKEEVSATVSDIVEPPPGEFPPPLLSNPFAAPQPAEVSAHLNGGSPAVTMAGMSIVGTTEPEAPRAEFLPPHLVPGSPRERYSVSSVDAMADCGLKFRLKYRDGVAATNISWAGVGGKAFHEVVRIIEREHAESTDGRWSAAMALLDQERTAATLWKNCFADEIEKEEASSGVPSAQWRATNGGKEGYDWWLHSGEEFVRAYIRWRPAFLAEGWTLLRQPNGETAQEIEFDVSVAGVMNKGFIDAAWINVDKGVIRVVDYKSGTSDNKPFQLKTYGHALRQLGALGDYRVEGAFYDARKPRWAADPMVLSADDDAEVEYRFQSTAAADRAGIFLARPSSYCGGCEVKASCPIMASKR